MDIMLKKETKEEFEDGELPEDGEICDDEEDVKTVKKAAGSPQRHAPPVQTQHHHHQQQQSAPVGMGGPPAREPKERGSDRPRRFEHNSPPARDPDPFGPHHSNESEQNDFFGGSGNGDKDYRSGGGSGAGGGPTQEEEPYADTDYRVNRRRRHSPAHDEDYDGRSKRPFFGRGGGYGRGGGNGGGFRNGQKPRFQTDHQICKFFREGFCRDGDNCSYSHQAEDSLRRPVLCNFYANSFCKKGLQCLMLHGEFPCKEFHKGMCQNDACRFSHVPLTDYTRPIIEKILAEEEARQPHQPPTYRQNPVANAAAAAAAANVMPRRRVLLPGGPSMNATSPPHAPIIHAPVPQAGHMNGGQLPPPAVVVPTIQRNMPPMYPPAGSGGYFNAEPQPRRPEQVQGLPPPRTIEPPRLSAHAQHQQQQGGMMRQMQNPHQMPHHLQHPGMMPPPQQVQIEKRPASPPAFNLEAMLSKLANGDRLTSGPNDNDSPASPPQTNFRTNAFGVKQVAVIPKEVQVTWGLVRVQKRLPYSNVENVEKIPANDPRRAKAIAKQFDAFSSSILSSGAAPVVSDPRLRAQQKESAPAAAPARQQTTQMSFSSWMPQIS